MLLAMAPFACAQWQTQSFDLVPGWNAIYLHVDATHVEISEFANDTAVEEVWLWKPSGSTAQYVVMPDAPTDSKSRWLSWKVGLGDNTSEFSRMPGNLAYLVKLKKTVAQAVDAGGQPTGELTYQYADPDDPRYTWNIKGKPVPPVYQWTTTGLNFFGVPAVTGSSNSLTDYFQLAGYLLQNTRFFAYIGGEISSGTNPEQVYGTRLKIARRGEAYWMDAGAQFNRYFGPFDLTLQSAGGAHLGDTLSTYRIRLRNMTSANLTVSVTNVASDTPPAGQTPIEGSAPVLVRDELDTATLVYGHEVLSVGSPSWTQTLKPKDEIGSEVEVVLGLDRAAMTGAPGTLYASLLRFTDSLGHSQIDIPVSGEVGSGEGLWVGAVAVTQVRHSLSTDTNTFGEVASPYPLRLLLHKEKLSGVTVVPNDITVGSGVTVDGAVVQGAGVSVSVGPTLRDYQSGEVLTFSGGGELTLTTDAAAGATTLTGNLAGADIADAETVQIAPVSQGTGVSVPVAALPRPYSTGNQVVFSGGGVLTLTDDALVDATTMTGNLTVADIADSETTSTGATLGTGTVSVAVTTLPRPLYAGEAIGFSGGGVLTLTANAPVNSVLLTGTLTGADIAQDETGGANRIKMLQRVFVGTLASGNDGVATRESLMDAEKLETSERISCVHLPVSESNLPWVCGGGDLASGEVLSVTVDVAHDDQASNPFLHTYHPDHDNLSAGFTSVQAVGRESYRIRREMKLTFELPGSGFASLTRTGKQLTGSYEETMTLFGLATSGAANEKSYAVKGALVLNRISNIATLTTE